MKIKELSEKAGLTAYAIRFYEREGFLDHRHCSRDANNYRNYSDEAIERLKLIKKFQGVGCSLTELKELMQAYDANTLTEEEVIQRIRQKIGEFERKKSELDQILGTLNWMLEYRIALMMNDREKLESLIMVDLRNPARVDYSDSYN